jgi:hypothetical protein
VRNGGAAVACGGAAGLGGRTDGGVTTTAGSAGGAAGVAACVGAAGGVASGAGGAAGETTGGVIAGRRAGGAAGIAGAAGLAVTGGWGGGAGATGRTGVGATCRPGASGTRAAGRAGAGCVFCWIAFRTSPGLEICERSNFGRISSAVGRLARVSLSADVSRCPVKCCRTFSASSASIELEWVFFSATPIEGRRSRISLLLTSSSLARSLIRIFGCIRPVLLRISVKSSSQPHGFSG